MEGEQQQQQQQQQQNADQQYQQQQARQHKESPTNPPIWNTQETEEGFRRIPIECGVKQRKKKT